MNKEADMTNEQRLIQRIAALRLTEEQRRYLEEVRTLWTQQPHRTADVWMYPATDKDEAAEFLAQSAHQSTETQIWGVYLKEESMPEGEIDGERYVEHTVSSATTGNGPRSKHYAYLYASLHNWLPFLLDYLTEVYALAGDAAEIAAP